MTFWSKYCGVNLFYSLFNFIITNQVKCSRNIFQLNIAEKVENFPLVLTRRKGYVISRFSLFISFYLFIFISLVYCIYYFTFPPIPSILFTLSFAALYRSHAVIGKQNKVTRSKTDRVNWSKY